MGRLSVVVLFTPEIARQREFYEKTLGLDLAASGDRWLQFGTRDAALALRPLAAGAPARIELAFDVRSLDERLRSLTAHGVATVGALEDSPECRIARIADPEGNVVQLVERRRPTAGGRWPRLSHAIVNAQGFESCAHFYHDVLGFRMAEEREHWIEFDTGDARLTLHAWRDGDGLPLAPDQRVSFALMDDDLDAWADELRQRGVRFATSPSEEELGRFAEVEDADGWFVVLRGPSPEVPIEEALAAEFADDDHARIEQIRRSTEAEPGGRPGFGSRKLARKKVERVATRGFDALQRAREPGAGRAGGSDGFTPGARPERPGGFPPRTGAGGPPRGDRPFTPGGPPRGDRPFTPGGPPRGDRPFPPRPGPGGSPRGDRPHTSRTDRPGGPGAGPRPGSPPRSDRPPGAGGSRPSGGAPRPPRPDRPGAPPPPRTGGPARGRPRDER